MQPKRIGESYVKVGWVWIHPVDDSAGIQKCSSYSGNAQRQKVTDSNMSLAVVAAANISSLKIAATLLKKGKALS